MNIYTLEYLAGRPQAKQRRPIINLQGCKLNKPHFEKAKEFSAETLYYANPFGVHKLNTGNLPKEELEMLKKNINGLYELIRLQ
jgi:hypothetical protein